MKHLLRYNGYSIKDKLDEILDKINKYGISSLTALEKEFLDSHSTGKEKDVYDKIIKEETYTFEDSNGYFKFEYLKTENYGDEVHYIGTLYVPDLELGKQIIPGKLEGKIIVYNNGQIIPDFQHEIDSNTTYDIFEFCNGLEYELDSFLDYVVSELE